MLKFKKKPCQCFVHIYIYYMVHWYMVFHRSVSKCMLQFMFVYLSPPYTILYIIMFIRYYKHNNIILYTLALTCNEFLH